MNLTKLGIQRRVAGGDHRWRRALANRNHSLKNGSGHRVGAAENIVIDSCAIISGVLLALIVDVAEQQKEKGSTANAALLHSASVDQSSDVSVLVLRRWRRFISPCRAETTNCPVVSPESFNSSIAFATSCGTLAAIVCDFLFIDFVAISASFIIRCSTVWHKQRCCKWLTCSTLSLNLVFNTLSTGRAQVTHKTAMPQSAETLLRHLTTNDSQRIEAAMGNHTQTQPKFTWRFLALSASSLAVVRIVATTEHEARDQSPVGCVMVFSSRLPVGAHHA